MVPFSLLKNVSVNILYINPKARISYKVYVLGMMSENTLDLNYEKTLSMLYSSWISQSHTEDWLQLVKYLRHELTNSLTTVD